MENLPITSTTCSNSIMGYTNEKENIVLEFTETDIIQNMKIKCIELEYDSEIIYNVFHSGELYELFER